LIQGRGCSMHLHSMQLHIYETHAGASEFW
jgi:hypothetical protein